MTILEGKNFFRISSAIDTNYEINPFDYYGNLITNIWIQTDTSTAPISILLPDLASLDGRFNIKINVVDIAGSASANNITINTSGGNLIDQTGTTSVAITNSNSSIYIIGVSDDIWTSLESFTAVAPTPIVIQGTGLGSTMRRDTGNTASGNYSTALGRNNCVDSLGSFVNGDCNTASGYYHNDILGGKANTSGRATFIFPNNCVTQSGLYFNGCFSFPNNCVTQSCLSFNGCFVFPNNCVTQSGLYFDTFSAYGNVTNIANDGSSITLQGDYSSCSAYLPAVGSFINAVYDNGVCFATASASGLSLTCIDYNGTNTTFCYSPSFPLPFVAITTFSAYANITNIANDGSSITLQGDFSSCSTYGTASANYICAIYDNGVCSTCNIGIFGSSLTCIDYNGTNTTFCYNPSFTLPFFAPGSTFSAYGNVTNIANDGSSITLQGDFSSCCQYLNPIANGICAIYDNGVCSTTASAFGSSLTCIDYDGTNTTFCYNPSFPLPFVVNGSCYSSVLNGNGNTASTENFSSVINGNINNASGCFSTISNGCGNTSSACYSSVNNGRGNTASGYFFSSVINGSFNTAGGTCTSSVINGSFNTSSALYSSVNNGFQNTATGSFSSVNNGRGNTASGRYSSVNGKTNTASNVYSSVINGCCNIASGGYSSIINGCFNTSSGSRSSVNNGRGNTASGSYSSVINGYSNASSNCFSSIINGCLNTSSGCYSSVNNGKLNTASGVYSSANNGRLNTASACYGSIINGVSNVACGAFSSVLNGCSNTSSGRYSFIGTGFCNTSSGCRSLIVGGFKNLNNLIDGFIGGGNNNSVCNSISPCLSYGAVVVGGVGNNTTGGTWSLASCCFTIAPTICNAGQYSFIGGGFQNLSTGLASAVLGGCLNTASCDCSFIVGSNITSDRVCTTFVNALSMKTAPTSSAGLPPGTVWVDTTAGNVLKMV